jgi:hypothetical protein
MRWNRGGAFCHSTRKKFTVVVQCCDPPVPVWFLNTNDEAQAQWAFLHQKNDEIKSGGGGEFEIVMFQHYTRVELFRQNPIKTMKVPAAESEYDGKTYVYNIDYPKSIRVQTFSYMDLAEFKLKMEQEGKNPADPDGLWGIRV